MPDIADSEAAFVSWLESDESLGPEVHSEPDSDEQLIVAYRVGGPTDPGTYLDHPQMVVSCYGATPPAQTPKHTVATTALDALARALGIKGNTVDGVVFTDAFVANGIQRLPEPDRRHHYQFTVQLTTHPEPD